MSDPGSSTSCPTTSPTSSGRPGTTTARPGPQCFSSLSCRTRGHARRSPSPHTTTPSGRRGWAGQSSRRALSTPMYGRWTDSSWACSTTRVIGRSSPGTGQKVTRAIASISKRHRDEQCVAPCCRHDQVRSPRENGRRWMGKH